MTYMENEKADRIYKILKEKWGAERLLDNIIGLMSDDLYEMYMNELGEGEGIIEGGEE